MSLLSRLFGKKVTEEKLDPPPEVLPLRNDDCWCGSGLKYKKCHQEQDNAYLRRQRDKELAAKRACSPTYG